MQFLTNLLTSQPAAMLLSSSDEELLMGMSLVMVLVYLLVLGAMSILLIVANWIIFKKARTPGWYSIIPFVCNYALFDIVYGNGWKFLLLLVPGLNTVVMIMLYVRLAQVFGKGALDIFLLLFFTPIGLLKLAFGNARYQRPCRSFL